MCVCVCVCVCICIYILSCTIHASIFSSLFKMLCTGMDKGINIMWIPSDTGKQLV